MYVKVNIDVEIDDENVDDVSDVITKALKRFENDNGIMVMSVDVTNNDTNEVIVTSF